MIMYQIYYLTSSKDDYKPKYIGYTSLDLQKRLYYHIKESKYNKNKHKTYKVNWIRKLLDENIKIEIFSIHNNVEKLNEILILERYYIEKYNNNELTNSTNGGEISKTFKPEVIEKIKNSLHEYYKNNSPRNKGIKSNVPSKFKGVKNPKMSGENNPFYNKKHTNETKKIISQKNMKHRIYSYDELYDMYINLNMNQNEIAEKLNLTKSYVCRLMKKYKLTDIKKKTFGKIKSRKKIICDI